MFDGDLKVIKQAALNLYFFYSIWRVKLRAAQITGFGLGFFLLLGGGLFWFFGSATEWQT